MELEIDLSTGGIALRGREDMQRFSVHALGEHPGDGPTDGGLGALAAALSVHDAGTVGPDGDVLVPPDVVHRLAVVAARQDGTSLAPEWESEFTDMVAHASTKGWTAEDGALRAHVEWVA
jgi:hypothetical protein